ncbi:DEAD/DEAH box helicase family protein [Mycoplasma sp. SG1]|uniref:DEAD/DEAH box helicase family protein n=1 Tax=Mycoplasma sp. SG1 TaxID=2810348 RepID=UPI0020241BB3|nr:DEAD/DEAH box helicase family protein [Mycoplasma sp. SG1]
MFKINSSYDLKADQINAVENLVNNIKSKKKKHNVLLGATGTGKTFTIANVIQKLNLPTLIIAHNKTLAAQLYGEYKALFKDNCVEYYISYFDFYQPEAYLPSSGTYIDKTSKINDLIKMLRLSTLNGVTQHKDVVVIASVASIYGTIDPNEYKTLFLEIKVNDVFPKMQILKRLIEIGYLRNQLTIEKNGFFYARGDVIEISPGWTSDFNIRIELYGDTIEKIVTFSPYNHNILHEYKRYVIFPADDYLYNIDRTKLACIKIKEELKERITFFTNQQKLAESERIQARTNKDVEDLLNFNICHGIENYGRHLENRPPGSAPFTLIDFFNLNDWLLIIDESHMTIPKLKVCIILILVVNLR